MSWQPLVRQQHPAARTRACAAHSRLQTWLGRWQRTRWMLPCARCATWTTSQSRFLTITSGSARCFSLCSHAPAPRFWCRLRRLPRATRTSTPPRQTNTGSCGARFTAALWKRPEIRFRELPPRMSRSLGNSSRSLTPCRRLSAFVRRDQQPSRPRQRRPRRRMRSIVARRALAISRGLPSVWCCLVRQSSLDSAHAHLASLLWPLSTALRSRRPRT
mmetsp:Transcript_18016/g.63688  ORF Transcript_18016/g.63688 Transcript_18016/m.63688 type:complete len:217 (+) Transcript_18016:1006-1656(+)